MVVLIYETGAPTIKKRKNSRISGAMRPDAAVPTTTTATPRPPLSTSAVLT